MGSRAFPRALATAHRFPEGLSSTSPCSGSRKTVQPQAFCRVHIWLGWGVLGPAHGDHPSSMCPWHPPPEPLNETLSRHTLGKVQGRRGAVRRSSILSPASNSVLLSEKLLFLPEPRFPHLLNGSRSSTLIRSRACWEISHQLWDWTEFSPFGSLSSVPLTSELTDVEPRAGPWGRQKGHLGA